MSRRDFLRALQQLAHLEHHPMYNYGCMPRRSMRYFCTRNNAANHPANPTQQQNNSTHLNESDYYDNHFGSSFNERQRQFIKEFDDLHRQYFNQLPLRRYAFHDQFSHLDKIFNQEFNRLRNSFLESQQKESQTSKQQQQQQQSEKVDNNTKQQEQKVEAQENKSESKNVETQPKQQNERSLEKDPFFSFDSFFESPRYISDVHNLFHQEQQRLQKMIDQFETDFEKKVKENDPNVHTVRSYYKRTPEGETREYYDSKNPERNFKAEKKFEKPTLDSSSSQQNVKNSSTQENNSQQEQKTTQMNNTESNAQTQQSAQPLQPKQEEVPQQKQVHEEPIQQTASTTASAQNKSSGHIDISPELNLKAKNLSLMLKKEYLECLELARVYPNKSVGQIIDMVIESESYNKSY